MKRDLWWWAGAAGVVLWVLAFVSVFTVPGDVIRAYGAVWATATALFSGMFILGYMVLSNWNRSEEGWHILAFSAFVCVSAAWGVVFRVFLFPIEVQLPINSAIWVTGAFLCAWRLTMWGRRQLRLRRKGA